MKQIEHSFVQTLNMLMVSTRWMAKRVSGSAVIYQEAGPGFAVVYQEAVPGSAVLYQEVVPRFAVVYQEAGPESSVVYQKAAPRSAIVYQEAGPEWPWVCSKREDVSGNAVPQRLWFTKAVMTSIRFCAKFHNQKILRRTKECLMSCSTANLSYTCSFWQDLVVTSDWLV